MVFTDSSAFVAAFDCADARHAEPSRAWRSIAAAKEAPLTARLVLAR